MTVYNAFLFFQELDLLETRLNELDSVVDFWILTESDHTHSGVPKPFYFNEHKHEERFKKFEHKIIHQMLTDVPSNYLTLHTDPNNDELYNLVIEKVLKGDWWDHSREDYGRITIESESSLRAMGMCKPEDIIILDEADEIPRKEILKLVIDNFDPNQIYNFENRFYYYYFNCLKDETWIGSTVLTFKKFKKLSLCEMRMRRRGLLVKDAGWHFSYMGGPDVVKYKVESHAEQMLNTKTIRDNIPNAMENCFTIGRDIYFRPANFKKVAIDESYPEYIYKNQEKFKDYIIP